MKFFQKKLIAFIFILANLLTAAANVRAQTGKEIAAIRSEVGSINRSAKKYTKKTKNVEGLSAEGAEAIYFVGDREIKKIAAKIYGETSRSTAEIYYRNERPIFIFLKTSRYKSPIGTTKSVKIISTKEQRIYLADGKTVRMIIGKTVLKSSDARYEEVEKSLTELAETFSAAYGK